MPPVFTARLNPSNLLRMVSPGSAPNNCGHPMTARSHTTRQPTTVLFLTNPFTSSRRLPALPLTMWASDDSGSTTLAVLFNEPVPPHWRLPALALIIGSSDDSGSSTLAVLFNEPVHLLIWRLPALPLKIVGIRKHTTSTSGGHLVSSHSNTSNT